MLDSAFYTKIKAKMQDLIKLSHIYMMHAPTVTQKKPSHFQPRFKAQTMGVSFLGLRSCAPNQYG